MGLADTFGAEDRKCRVTLIKTAYQQGCAV